MVTEAAGGCEAWVGSHVQKAGARHQAYSALEEMPAPAAMYEIMYKNPSEHHCMQVCLGFQSHGLDWMLHKQLLISALKDLFEGKDAALLLNMLTYQEKTLSAILRICSHGLINLWSS